MNQQSEAESNTQDLIAYFQELLEEEGEKGDIGVTSLHSVFDVLMDVQIKRKFYIEYQAITIVNK